MSPSLKRVHLHLRNNIANITIFFQILARNPQKNITFAIETKTVSVIGIFIDKGNLAFKSIKNSDFIDKSGLIEILNGNINTQHRYICVSRPRRFGKSVAAKMIYAYYDRKSDSAALFDDLEISKSESYKNHLNKYPTIYIDLNTFAEFDNDDVVALLQKQVIEDLKMSYPFLKESEYLSIALREINQKTGDRFVVVIDEWDKLVREIDEKTKNKYVNFLRSMFKSNIADDVFLLVYMTGILPIIKVESQSALNNFDEYSVIRPAKNAKYYGFTPDEVVRICDNHNLNIELMKHAYDGYIIGSEKSIFNPNSVMLAAEDGEYNSHWSKSAAYTTIEHYIGIDHDAVQQKIIRMLNGESVTVDDGDFRLSLDEINNYKDVLTLLVIIGYLTYDREYNVAKIPNRETAESLKELYKIA